MPDYVSNTMGAAAFSLLFSLLLLLLTLRLIISFPIAININATCFYAFYATVTTLLVVMFALKYRRTGFSGVYERQ